MSTAPDHTPAQWADLAGELARLRNGLHAWRIDNALQALHAGNDNAARARAASIEARIANLLGDAPPVPHSGGSPRRAQEQP